MAAPSPPRVGGCAVVLKWGRSTLAFFQMRNTHSGVCGHGILTRHWAFDGSEARRVLACTPTVAFDGISTVFRRTGGTKFLLPSWTQACFHK